jgi:uncharacterized membrane protein
MRATKNDDFQEAKETEKEAIQECRIHRDEVRVRELNPRVLKTSLSSEQEDALRQTFTTQA